MPEDVVTPPAPLALGTAELLRSDPAKFPLEDWPARDVLCASSLADPLLAMMEAVGRKVQAAGLTEADVDAELAAWNAERR